MMTTNAPRLVSAILALDHHRAAVERRDRQLRQRLLRRAHDDVVLEHADSVRIDRRPWTWPALESCFHCGSSRTAGRASRSWSMAYAQRVLLRRLRGGCDG